MVLDSVHNLFGDRQFYVRWRGRDGAGLEREFISTWGIERQKISEMQSFDNQQSAENAAAEKAGKAKWNFLKK